MKKLSFLTVAIFAGSIAMAQNTSTTTQNGNANSATIDQDGSGNTSTLTQSSNNTFELNQTGDDNLSNFRQGLYGGNEAYINQLGDRNKVTRGGGALQGTNNLANIDQTGDDNTANVYQDFKDHTLDIDQVGSGNFAKANQDGGVSGSDLIINQVGDNNRSDGGYQNNGYNYSNTQILGSDNWTSTHQDGDGNNITIDITGSGNGNILAGSAGDDYISVSQTSDGNMANIDITGDYNDVNISQDGVGGHTASVMQDGNLNTASVMQDGTGHISTTTQTGNGNIATVTQND